MMKLVQIFFLLTLKYTGLAQCYKSAEEIALYHLDKLTTEGKVNFKYFTNGYIEKEASSVEDTLLLVKHNRIVFTNPFPLCDIVINNEINKISIPNKHRHSKTNQVLNIYRAVKRDNLYYVEFSLFAEDDVVGKRILLTMNLKGDLIKLNYSYYIE